MFSRQTCPRQKWRWYHTFTLIVLLALGATLLAMKVMWGYCFVRPGLDSRVERLKSVASITPVVTGSEETGQRVFVVDQQRLQAGWRASVDRAHADPYYSLDERVLLSLDRRGLLVNAPTAREAVLRPLYACVEATGLLQEGSAGYKDAKNLAGVVVEATGEDAKDYLFVGITGGQISNDHYPYYEFLFESPAAPGRPKLLSSRRFYYEVAGIEGMEGIPSFLFLFPLSLAGCALLVFMGRIAGEMAVVDYTEYRQRP